jgi:cytochrome c553
MTAIKHVGLLASLILGAATCGGGTPSPSERPPRGASRSAPVPMETIDSQMHEQFAALRDVHGALIRGDLALARQHGAVLQRLTAEGELGVWEDRVSFVRERADLLVAAETPAAARLVATELATYCADCHMFEADPSLFVPAPEPPDDGTLDRRMARHEWAAEALWLGLIAPSTERWREGLAIMAKEPPAPDSIRVAPERQADVARLGARLSDLAARSAGLPGQGDRARAFADIIDVCASCHAIALAR